MKDVKVYTTYGCMACETTVKWLRRNKIKFDEIEVSENPEAQLFLKKEVGHRFVPVIVADGKILDGTKLWFDALEKEFLKK